MKKFSVLIAGRHATSISLEDEFYADLNLIAERQKMSRNQLVTLIDQERTIENLSSAIRLYILQYWKQRLTTPKWGWKQHQNGNNFQASQKHGKH